jgi:hypothetical protein
MTNKRTRKSSIAHRPPGFKHATALIEALDETEHGRHALELMEGVTRYYASLLRRFGGPRRFSVQYDPEAEREVCLKVYLEHCDSDAALVGH